MGSPTEWSDSRSVSFSINSIAHMLCARAHIFVRSNEMMMKSAKSENSRNKNSLGLKLVQDDGNKSVKNIKNSKMNEQKSDRIVVNLENYVKSASLTDRKVGDTVTWAGPTGQAFIDVAHQVIRLGKLMDKVKRFTVYGDLNQDMAQVLVALHPENQDMSLADLQLTREKFQMLHSAMGMVTQAAELLEVVCQHVFGGQPLDVVGITEELGDGNWYEALMCRTIDVTFQDVLQSNIDKSSTTSGFSKE
jgi:hypothetical protein